MIGVVIAFLGEVAVKSSLLILIAAVGTWTARKAPAAVRHRIWSSALAAIALLPLVMALAPRWGIPVLPAQSEALTVSAASTSGSTDRVERTGRLVGVGTPESGTTRHGMPWEGFLSALYGAGAMVSALGLGLSLWRLRRVARHSSPPAERETRALKLVADLLGITPPSLRVARQGGPQVPMTWGARRAVLLLPRCAESWPEDHLRAALAHEAAHIRRGDWALHLAVRALCILYWFHPLVRWAAARLRIEAERACDDLALLSGIHAADYAACLLEVTRMNRDDRLRSVAALPMAHKTALAERLRAVLDSEAQRQERRRGVGVVITVAAMTAVLVTGALQATPSRPAVTRSNDMALMLDMIQGRSTLQMAPKSKASLQNQVNALRARLKAAEAEVRRLRALESHSSTSSEARARMAEGDATVEVRPLNSEHAKKRRVELEFAQAKRDSAAAALAHAADQLKAADAERAKAESLAEAQRAAVSADLVKQRALDERARALEALNDVNDARGQREKDDLTRKEAYERAFRAQTEANELLKRRAVRERVREESNARRELDAERAALTRAREALAKDIADKRRAIELDRGRPDARDPNRRGGGLGGDRLGEGLGGGLGGDRLGEGLGGAPLGADGSGLGGRLPLAKSRDARVTFGDGSGRRTAATASRSVDDQLEELNDQVRHIDLDIAAANRRFQRAQERYKAGAASVEEAEDAQLHLQHLELDRDSVTRRIKRLQSTRKPTGSGVGR